MYLNSHKLLLIIIVVLGIFLLLSCSIQEDDIINESDNTKLKPSSSNVESTLTLSNDDEKESTNTPNEENYPITTMIPGYNSYGIPQENMWMLLDENGELKENYSEVIAQIKDNLGIPQCITGIPFNETERSLLLDEKGNLVSDWETILEKIKQDWQGTE